MSDETQLELPLPGLDEPAGKPGALELAVRRTFRSIEDDGILDESDAGRLQLAVELAQIIELKKQTKRTSTVSNDARLLVEILDKLTGADVEGSDDRRLRDAMAAWSEHIERERQALAGGAG